MKNGVVAEWLGIGLQIRVQRFESARRLLKSRVAISGNGIFFACAESFAGQPLTEKPVLYPMTLKMGCFTIRALNVSP